MTREQATEIEQALREFYNDKTGEIQMPEIVVDGEDITYMYDNLFSTEYLDGIPDFKISVPIIPKLNKEQAINLIIELFQYHKSNHKSPFVNKEWKD